jgi:hypothetical protein
MCTYLLRGWVVKPAIVGVVDLTAKVHDFGSLFSGKVHVEKMSSLAVDSVHQCPEIVGKGEKFRFKIRNGGDEDSVVGERVIRGRVDVCFVNRRRVRPIFLRVRGI